MDWMPVVDILEANEHVEIRAEIPGLSEKDVQVSVTDDVLTLKGEKTQASEENDQKYHRVERSYGRFQRSFTLPANLNPEDIKAKFMNGVLTVSIPKAKEVQPKRFKSVLNNHSICDKRPAFNLNAGRFFYVKHTVLF